MFLVKNKDSKELYGTVVSIDSDTLSVKDSDDVIYTFNHVDDSLSVGDSVIVTYIGLLDKNSDRQNVRLLECLAVPTSLDYDVFNLRRSSDLFSKYYPIAEKYVKKMSLDEKIGQLLLVRYSDDGVNITKNYKVGGFVFFERDFAGKNKSEVYNMIKSLQDVSKVPLITSVDEEGGSVVRISSNANLRSTPFKSPSDLYDEGGLDLIKEDVVEKSKLLRELGLNVNLAPVVDVSSSSSYMYNRTLKEDTDTTSRYADAVISASRGSDVSYVLKHFPGYGDNSDTHDGAATDSRSLDEIRNNDLPPFVSGIDAGAEAILVSHNTVSSIDPDNPASLSRDVHELLRDDLSFSGIIMTDDLAMGATSSIPNAVSKAFLAGNDIVMVTDYEDAYNDLYSAIDDGDISEEELDNSVVRIIAWKYYKGLMFDTK